MLDRNEYEKLMDSFEIHYNNKLGEPRRNLLYAACNKATVTQFHETLVEMMKRTNKETLPTCSIISGFLYTAYPETRKFNGPFDFKLRIVA